MIAKNEKKSTHGTVAADTQKQMTTVGVGNTLETLQDASFHEPSPRSEVIVFDSRQHNKIMQEDRPRSISRSRSRGHKSK